MTRPSLDAGDSGICFRGHFPCQAKTWSQDLGLGEVNGCRTNRELPVGLRQFCLPFKNADRPLGDWNVFRIRLQNDRMSVNLNGRLVLQTESMPDLPRTGPSSCSITGIHLSFAISG